MNVPLHRAMAPTTQRRGSLAGRGVWRYVPIADAYLFSHLWQAAREGAAMFAGLVLVFAIIAGASQGDEPLSVSAWLHALALQTPRVLAFTLPMALLHACIKAFFDLSGRGELVALCAAGQGWPRLLRAPLLLGLLAGLAALLLQEWVVPQSEQARLSVLQSAAQDRARTGFELTSVGGARIRSGRFFHQIVHARSADFARGELSTPVVKKLRPNGSLHRQIVAARGRWDDRAAVMVFENGWILELPEFLHRAKEAEAPAQTKVQARRFKRFAVKEFPPPERWSGVLTLRDMINDGRFEALSLPELQAERARSLDSSRVALSLPDPEVQASALTFAIHDRLSAPLVCVALVLIGCPLGVRAPRTSGISPLGRALIVLLAYFVVWLLASHIGKSGAPVPLLWAYSPLLLFLVAGLALLRCKPL